MDRFIFRLAKLMALLGGLVLISLVAITCLSVLGRSINTIGHSQFIKDNLSFLGDVLKLFGPINGDYELVEAGIAFAIFSFLPWCQLNRGHATVELLTAALPRKLDGFLAFLWELVFSLATLLIAWRIYVGMTDKIRYGETTFLLQFPVWWGFAACSAAAAFAGTIALYSTWMSAREHLQGHRSALADRSSGH